jgi:hypothetical protein
MEHHIEKLIEEAEPGQISGLENGEAHQRR